MKQQLASLPEPQTQSIFLNAYSGKPHYVTPTLSAVHEAVVRYLFYAFVFSVPFEVVAAEYIGLLQNTVPKFVGIVLAALTLIRSHRYYRHIPRPLLLFAVYFGVY